MEEQNLTTYIDHDWSNITIGRMIRFFGIILCISMEPMKMGGISLAFLKNQLLYWVIYTTEKCMGIKLKKNKYYWYCPPQANPESLSS